MRAVRWADKSAGGKVASSGASLADHWADWWALRPAVQMVAMTAGPWAAWMVANWAVLTDEM